MLGQPPSFVSMANCVQSGPLPFAFFVRKCLDLFSEKHKALVSDLVPIPVEVSLNVAAFRHSKNPGDITVGVPGRDHLS